MTIEVVSALPAASSPSHPDHARWVKEQMLRREVSWLRGRGVDVSTSASEAHVDEGMRRLAARKRERKLQPRSSRPMTRAPNQNVGHELARESGYTFRQSAAGRVRDPVARAAPARWECGRCGGCLRCKRELRALNIVRMGRAGDSALKPLAVRLVMTFVRARARIGAFEGLSDHDVNRVLTANVEAVCDLSVPIAGPWR